MVNVTKSGAPVGKDIGDTINVFVDDTKLLHGISPSLYLRDCGRIHIEYVFVIDSMNKLRG